MWRRTFAVALIVLALVPCSAPFATCALDDIAPLFGATTARDRLAVAEAAVPAPVGVVLQKRVVLKGLAGHHTLQITAAAVPPLPGVTVTDRASQVAADHTTPQLLPLRI